MPETLNIALIGGGTVGGGVAKILLEHPERIAARAARPVHLKRVVVRDPNKPRPDHSEGTDLDGHQGDDSRSRRSTSSWN